MPANLRVLRSRAITKKYYKSCDPDDPFSDFFQVTVAWVDEDGYSVGEDEYSFQYFIEFISFLKGDLSDADLLDCSGLMNLQTIAGINFSNATVRSAFEKKFGLPMKKVSLPSLASEDPSIIQNEIQTRQQYDLIRPNQNDGRSPVYYISDLHLLHRIKNAKCLTQSDIELALNNIVDQIITEIFYDSLVTTCPPILLIAGDVTADLALFNSFVTKLGEHLSPTWESPKIIFTLGNHEFWPFHGQKLDEIINSYRKLLTDNGMFLLQNSLLCIRDGNIISEITEKQLKEETKEELQARVSKSRLLIFGGIGFAGYNESFNSDKGAIYGAALSRSEEIEETKIFENLYNCVETKLSNQKVIILTHNPVKDWLSNPHFHPNFIYVNGHTHRNVFSDDGIIRVYSDNQIGFRQDHFSLKHFYIDETYDIFRDYSDGIYQITQQQYCDFYQGKNISMTYQAKTDTLFMLKKNGVYCFIARTASGHVSILNGARKSRLPRMDPDYFYQRMDQVVARITNPLEAYNSFLKNIADQIQKIGGSGKIHGAIVDIDFFNHVYVNPQDKKITPYFAYDIIYKVVYPTLLQLLKERNQTLYLNCLSVTKDDESAKRFYLEPTGNQTAQLYLDTDIYQASNLIKKMQKLSSGILCVWNNTPNMLLLGNTNPKSLEAKKK